MYTYTCVAWLPVKMCFQLMNWRYTIVELAESMRLTPTSLKAKGYEWALRGCTVGASGRSGGGVVRLGSMGPYGAQTLFCSYPPPFPRNIPPQPTPRYKAQRGYRAPCEKSAAQHRLSNLRVLFANSRSASTPVEPASSQYTAAAAHTLSAGSARRQDTRPVRGLSHSHLPFVMPSARVRSAAHQSYAVHRRVRRGLLTQAAQARKSCCPNACCNDAQTTLVPLTSALG